MTIFSIVMNEFIELITQNDKNVRNNDDLLQKWFSLIKKIHNQPYGDGKDIHSDLKSEIETHFRYFWENDRTAILLEKKGYFDSIPF